MQPDDPGPQPREKIKPMTVWPWAFALVLLFVVLMLAGCGGYQPPVLINGYDPTLTSHAEALGWKEPRP